MSSRLKSYLITILLLLALASLCVSSSLNADDGSDNGTDLDAARRARAAATIDELLTVHNEARQAVGVPPLTWSAQIAAYAKNYGQSRRGDCAPRRSPLFYFGENISMVFASFLGGKKIIGISYIRMRDQFNFALKNAATLCVAYLALDVGPQCGWRQGEEHTTGAARGSLLEVPVFQCKMSTSLNTRSRGGVICSELQGQRSHFSLPT
ncbi:hypothetical protein PR202_ga30045 [Eleusine coracana subsp. coracana]|uniref:SCP domain-containing protein n=1 Tax=Eleusine coracana subsp. coracana TaxID=191504 RepID=A0AAV5DNQ2_ELECO|nr:hypothetical protein PR202_ga30045 [Eleusine coracana subsp. coracana]